MTIRLFCWVLGLMLCMHLQGCSERKFVFDRQYHDRMWEEYWVKASRAYYTGNCDVAQSLCMKALEQANALENSAILVIRTRKLLGDIFAQKHLYENAAANYTVALELCTNEHVPAIDDELIGMKLAMANLEMRRGNVSQAKRLYDELESSLKHNQPRHLDLNGQLFIDRLVEVNVKQAELAERTGDLSQSGSRYRRAVRWGTNGLGPAFYIKLAKEGLVRLEGSQPGRAKNEANGPSPANIAREIQTLIGKGDVLRSTLQYASAEKAYKSALALAETQPQSSPSRDEYYLSLEKLRQLYGQRRNFAALVPVLETLIDNSKSCHWSAATLSDRRMDLAESYFRTHNYSKAIPYCHQVLNSRSRDWTYSLSSGLLGEYYLEKRQYAEASRMFQQQLRTIPRDRPQEIPEALLHLSLSYLGNHDLRAFQETVVQAHKLPSKILVSAFLNQLARECNKRSEFMLADQYFFECCDIRSKLLSPDNPDLLSTQCDVAEFVYIRRGENEKAVQILRQATKNLDRKGSAQLRERMSSLLARLHQPSLP